MLGYQTFFLQFTMVLCLGGVVSAQAPVVERSEDPDRPSIFDGIRQIIGDSPAFDDNEATDGLVESLNHAEKLYKDIRKSNREAIRGMNRQVRIGRAKQSPHIILITIPQLRFDQLPEMPRLSGIQRSGMTFTNYYAPADSLAHSRWSLLTGQLATLAPLDSRMTRKQSLAEAMWKAGYETTIIGTWSTSQHPVELGFDHWTGFPSSSGVVEKYPEFFFTQSTKAKIISNGSSEQSHSLKLMSDEVTGFLAQHQRSSRQFFLHVGLPFIQGGASSDNIRNVDKVIGEIVDSINSLGMAGRMCLMVTGETSHQLAAKIEKDLPIVNEKLTYSQSGLNEGNLRTPLVVFWGNKTPRGSVNNFPCTGIDIQPTLLDLAQAQRKPTGLPGVSFERALHGHKIKFERLLYWKMENGGQSARRGRWKVIVPTGQKAVQLYDLEVDPSEKDDISSDHPDIVRSFIATSKAKVPASNEAL